MTRLTTIARFAPTARATQDHLEQHRQRDHIGKERPGRDLDAQRMDEPAGVGRRPGDRGQVGTEEDGDHGRGERGIGEVVEVPADALPAIRRRAAADRGAGTTFPSFHAWSMRLAAVTAASGVTGSPAERSALAVHVLQVFRRKYFSRAR